MGGDGMKNDKRKTAQAAATAKRGKAKKPTKNISQKGSVCKHECDKCGTELDEGDSAYFTGLDMLCLDCAEAAARAQAEQDTVETIQTRFHAMEQRGLTRRDIDALYDLLQDVMGDEESAIEDNLADMRVILDEWGEWYVA